MNDDGDDGILGLVDAVIEYRKDHAVDEKIRLAAGRLAIAEAKAHEAFIVAEMERLGISHMTGPDLVAHGYVLEMQQGFPHWQPRRLLHCPERDTTLQLCDY